MSGDTDRPARSYSQQHAYLECPRRYQLERIEKVPRRPGWWFPGGTAVHTTIERYLLETLKAAK